jgi:hypothetical protein
MAEVCERRKQQRRKDRRDNNDLTYSGLAKLDVAGGATHTNRPLDPLSELAEREG